MYASFPTDKLLDGELSEAATQSLLTSLGFRDWQTALRHLQQISRRGSVVRQSLSSLLPYLLITLSACADPQQALINLERFSGDASVDEVFQQLSETPRTLEILVTIFAGSQFLTEILLRDPRRLAILTDRARLARQKSAEEFEREALQTLENLPASEQLDALRRYQRGELLRIGASDLLSLNDLPAVTGQLSNLADGMTRACLVIASERSKISAAGFVILGMGKLGGSELNYSSDIDLLFLCAENGIDYLRLGQHLIEALASMTAEGFLYRVDMRLRPWGRDGSLVSTVNGYLGYLHKNARLWEKQALLKARPIAGDKALGEDFLRQVEPFIFGENPETLRASVLAM
jgi:glutamate-ammonia-ligase adenylyltransferase